ncbi:hypothetical protein [Streptomyces sp. NPDC047024]|uniref:hypothetical protein n=1 Tax=Streptomyces sp. NPDC047024 TaxID=3155476 RepID=UPI0033FEAF4E
MRAGRSGFVVVLAGALALGALAAPAAEAANTGVRVSNLVLNQGKPIVVGTTAEVTAVSTFHVTAPSGIKVDDVSAFPLLYHGTTPAKAVNSGGLYSGYTVCGENAKRPGDCRGVLSIDPRSRLDSNNDATTWKIAVWVRAWDANGRFKGEEFPTGFGTVQIKRAAKATVNASPEPVAKGKKLTVTGNATRADWVKHTYTGIGGKMATLQFRKAGTRDYVTVKKVTADSAGRLKTTVTASVDGYWRWTFGANSTTGGATSTADYVDVR